MARTALIIGGSGQIGRAVRQALVAEGWTVRCAQKTPTADDGADTVLLDRNETGALARAVGSGVDALIDTVAFDETHARQLLDIQQAAGALVVISSASVYRDARGRSLDEAAAHGFPHLPVPIAESQPTVPPGPATYSTRKAALEATLLRNPATPSIVLRPCAIHGPASRHPREWFFVKRLLDGRRAVPLAWRAESRFHTTATSNIAELIRIVLASPATQVLNIADPQPLTVSEIGRTIAGAMGRELDIVGFEGPPRYGVGASPWGVARPFVVDLSAASALGYRPCTTYAGSVEASCRAAQAAAAAGVRFPDYLNAMFDYAAEDAFLAAQPSVG